MIFTLTLGILSFLCLILYIYTKKINNEIASKNEWEFLELRRTYLIVYILAVC